MKPNRLVVGKVVKDPGATRIPEENRYFQCVEVSDPDVGPWRMQNISSQEYVTFEYSRVERLIEVAGEPFVSANFEGLLGQKVRLWMRFGSKPTGVVQKVRHFRVAYGDEEFVIPVELIVSGMAFPLEQVERIERLDVEAS